MFEVTATGYRATDETIAFWEARDACPACRAIVSPVRVENGVNYYRCTCAEYGRPRDEVREDIKSYFLTLLQGSQPAYDGIVKSVDLKP